MSPEFGHFCLALALTLAVGLSVLPLWGSFTGKQAYMSVARPGAHLLSILLVLSFCCLGWAFVHNDFTVKYVALHSNSFLPLHYRIAAIWGGHEGSLLLWVTVLTGWMSAVAFFSKGLPLDVIARVLSVMGFITTGFLLFTLLTSNPFERLLPDFPLDGKDLNPLLQDFGLVIHPPMLYMGYVGFSVAFAFAIAGLLGGRLDSAWARWSRPWTTIAWCFLTLGIALGSWWAYYELGWGGWWFWDPVENASFMPWLTGTALIHSLAVTEKRGVFKAWTVLLAILAFSLSLLGTFLVRSGVLTSVHAFASDPARGLYILLFLGVVIGGSLILFALRAHAFGTEQQYQPLSREMLLLVNNVILMGATTVVLLGTLFPLITEVLGQGKISVGPPYFNTLFVPLSLFLMGALGIGMLVHWKQHKPKVLWLQLRWVLLVSFLLGVGLPLILYSEMKLAVVLTFIFSIWVLGVSAMDCFKKIRMAQKGYWAGVKRLSRSYKGMLCAHCGVAIAAIGIAVTSYYSIEKDIRMLPGESVLVGGYRFDFIHVNATQGANYSAQSGLFKVYKGEKSVNIPLVASLNPEKRQYWASGSVMTEAAIDPKLTRDLYVALGEPLEDGAWAVRIYVKPLVRWMWLGAVLMALGGFMALSDRRYRLSHRSKTVAASKSNLSTQSAS